MHQYNFSRFSLYGIDRPVGLGVRLSVAALVLAAFLTTAGLFLMQPKTVLIWPLIAESNGLIFILNGLPVLLAMLFLFFTLGNLAAACGFGALLFAVPAFINRYMIALRHAPLTPFDFRLGMEFLGIAKSIRPAVYIAAGAGFIAAGVLIFLGIKFIKNQRPSVSKRFFCALGCVAVFIILLFTVYSNRDIYQNLPIEGSIYNETDQFQSKGFVYCFIYTWRTSRIEKPVYFEQYRRIIETNENQIFTGKLPEDLPDIIMVLSEAFSELDAENILMHYNEIKNEALHGYLVSPHIGGGTADIEFDILTGINTRDFRGVPYAFTLVTRQGTSGFARVLQQAGYGLTAMHPGTGWFYNRQNVYPLLGFDNFIDQESFDRKDTKGGYITEEQTINRIIYEYENRDNTKPFFLKAITIQNHGPYYKKYNDDKNEWENYLIGLKDSDAGLKILTDYLRQRPEPIVLAYYGDHLPSLPLSVYETYIPASDEPGGNLIRFNRVPFLIWANGAGESYINRNAFNETATDDRVISSFYFGALLLDMLGLSNTDPFMAYVNQLRIQYPVSLENTYRKPEGPFVVFDPEEAESLALYKSWAYYRVMGN